jgi:dCTP deaminase
MPGIKPDTWIREQATGGMITPFESGQVRTDPPEPKSIMQAIDQEVIGDLLKDSDADYPKKIISYGTSSYGYDLRVADEFKVFTPAWTKPGEAVVDPKNLDQGCMVDFKGPICRIPPNSFALCRSLERFKISRNVLAIILGKSTYARCGIIVNATPLEPGWEGYVTLELSNTTPLPAKIYANEGIAQVLFFQSDQPCLTSYADKKGKYQGQEAEVVLPKV